MRCEQLRRISVHNVLVPPALRSLSAECERGLELWVTLHPTVDTASSASSTAAEAAWRSPVATRSVNATWAVEEAELQRAPLSDGDGSGGRPFAWSDAFVVRLWSRLGERDVEICCWTVTLSEMVALPQRAFRPYFCRMPAFTLLLDMQDGSDGWGRVGRERCRIFCFKGLVTALATQGIIPLQQPVTPTPSGREEASSAGAAAAAAATATTATGEGEAQQRDFAGVARGLEAALEAQCALHTEREEIEALRLRIAAAIRRKQHRGAKRRSRDDARRTVAALQRDRAAEEVKLARDDAIAAALERRIETLRGQITVHARKMQGLLSTKFEAQQRECDAQLTQLTRVRHATRARQLKLIAGVQKLYPIREAEGRVFELMSRGLPSTEYADLIVLDEELVSTVMGCISHVLMLLSKYLEIPLRYTLLHGASRSRVLDPFMSTQKVRSFLPSFRTIQQHQQYLLTSYFLSPPLPQWQDAYPLFWSGEGKDAFRAGLHLLELDVDHLCWSAGVAPATAASSSSRKKQPPQRTDRRRRPQKQQKRNMLGDLHRLMSELILVESTPAAR